MTNAANITEVRKAQRQQGEREQRDCEDLRAVLKLVEGRRFVWRLLSNCKPLESPASSNGTVQSMNIGRGDVGRELIAWLSQAEASAYPRLMMEMAEQLPANTRT